ncbi:MAG: hypothetical protein JO353_00895, partial [Phycisphaerae bacterium]|nr:hypothetical protein [Phycisphaerae bacterium]
GGWSIHGPPETKAFNDLLDPEADEEKTVRIRELIDSHQNELISGGIVAEKLAARGKLPLQAVEAELKSYAKETPGLVAKRLDGRLVMYRDGSTPAVSKASSAGRARSKAGDSDMPMIDRIKALFSHKGEIEKKVSFLSERRTVLSLQRDQGYEEISALEQKDAELREEFAKARAPLTKRRITTQLVQLRKDIERRQQMLQVLNQQVNVVSTHLHNLELTQQGQRADLPDTEEIANDAAAAEEMLAKLQADNELADSVRTNVGTTSVGASITAGMSEEEQAMFAELESQSAPPTASPDTHAGTERTRAVPASPTTASSSPSQSQSQPRRANPEAT